MITTLQASCSQKHQTVTLITHTNLQEMSIPSLQRICSSPSIQPLILLKTLVVLIIATDRQEHSQSHVVVFFIETLTLYCSSHSAFRRLDLNCAISSTCKQHSTEIETVSSSSIRPSSLGNCQSRCSSNAQLNDIDARKTRFQDSGDSSNLCSNCWIRNVYCVHEFLHANSLQQFSLSSRLYHFQREFRDEENHSQNSPSALGNSKELQKNLDTHGRHQKDRSEYWPARSFLV